MCSVSYSRRVIVGVFNQQLFEVAVQWSPTGLCIITLNNHQSKKISDCVYEHTVTAYNINYTILLYIVVKITEKENNLKTKI